MEKYTLSLGLFCVGILIKMGIAEGLNIVHCIGALFVLLSVLHLSITIHILYMKIMLRKKDLDPSIFHDIKKRWGWLCKIIPHAWFITNLVDDDGDYVSVCGRCQSIEKDKNIK